MTRNARYLEIIIGTILVLLGSLSSYLVYYDINSRVEFVQNYTDLSGEISVIKILLNWHLAMIVSLLLFFSGIFLILSRKIGWYSALISGVYCSISWTLNSLTLTSEDFPNYWVGYIIGLFFLVVVVFLLSKPIRAKYLPNGRSYILVIVVISILFLDSFLV